MYSTNYLFRLVKIVAVAAIGMMSTIIFIGNVTDYFTNYLFVEHVLKMDTIFPDSHIRYRSLHSPFLFHGFYIIIIVLESLMSYCCIRGSIILFRSIKKDGVIFQAAKNWSIAGIAIGILVWFAGFEVIGGEWFGMWQSSAWNGLASAERILSFLMLTLILLHLKDE